MWRSKVSHRATVPSGRTSKFASVPRIPLSGQSGCAFRMYFSISSSRRPAKRGGARAVRHASQSANWRLSSSQPPSTHTIPRGSDGCRTASSRTTLPPHDCPATTGRSSSSRSIRTARSSATVGTSYGPSGFDERPCPRRSTVTTGWPRATSAAATPSQRRAFDASPCASTNAGWLPSTDVQTSAASVTPSATAIRSVRITGW